MRAWRTQGDGPENLRLDEVPIPVPSETELLVRVVACGVCRTDLHIVEGDLPSTRTPWCQATRSSEWWPRSARPSKASRSATGSASPGCAARADPADGARAAPRTCAPSSRYTGWDDDGGYAEYTVVPAAYAYRVPDGIADVDMAPLLCAGIIGYRSLQKAAVPPGGTLGIYGFGGSAHLTAQLAVSQGIDVLVFTRDESARRLALELGASWAGESADEPPGKLDSAIVFAPAGEVVPLALAALDQQGTVALAGIHMSDIPALDYRRHLFGERTLTSVTSNTRADGEEFLRLAEGVVRATVTPYPFERAPDALRDLADGRVNGAAVLEL